MLFARRSDPHIRECFGTARGETVKQQDGQRLASWVDEAMLADYAESQATGLGDLEQLVLHPAISPEGRAHFDRVLHTLKGEATTLGMDGLGALYHALEDFVRSAGDLSQLVDIVLDVKDHALAAVEKFVADRDPSARFDEQLIWIKEETLRLEREKQEARAKEENQAEAEVASHAAASHWVASETGSESESEPETESHPAAAAGTTHAAPSRDDASHEETSREDASHEETSREDASHESEPEPEPEFESEPEVEIEAAIEPEAESPIEPEVEIEAAVEPEAESESPNEPDPDSARSPDSTSSSRPSVVPAALREFIKIDLTRVDNLVESIGELVVLEAMLDRVIEESGADHAVLSQLAQVNKVVRRLQGQGMSLRMVPMRGLFQKMNRLVHDLSRRCDKDVRLELAGEDAEMDRSVAERLGEPLMHMVRNAVDHGIESPEERIAAGKPAHGTIHLQAMHEGGHIIIELRDDGRGIDRDAILARAIERGLFGKGADPTDAEIWELIFHPGFSTAAEVTELSGRGVGMDVVRRTVEEIRGRVSIHSEPGRGTTFRFVLPLTLAIIDGMLVRVGAGRYVIPTTAIIETVHPEDGDIRHPQGTGPVLKRRGSHIRLLSLADVFDVDPVPSEACPEGLVVVLDGVGSRFGVRVDDVVGKQQIVIKQLDSTVNGSGLFSGAAILADGRVGLVINPMALEAEAPRSDDRRARLEA